MNVEQSVKSYLEQLSSNSPTPGGGNVSAFCGALAASLGIMVCELTIGKKKYADVEKNMIEYKEKLSVIKEKFLQLANKDNEAFDKVMEAFKMPKETEEQKAKRNAAIQEATLVAAKVPLTVMKNAFELLDLLQEVYEKGNKNSASDAGVAVLLANAACQGAYLNVLINAASLENKANSENLINESNNIARESSQKTSDIFEKTKNGILS
jgi:formiminotetrahydrofolate cyclodeaminase